MQATQEIKKDLSDFNYGSVSKAIVGLLYVPLPSGGRDFMVFLRNTQEAEDTWTNPLISIPGGNSIAQSKVLTGKSREWTAEQLSNAEDLSSLYGQVNTTSAPFSVYKVVTVTILHSVHQNLEPERDRCEAIYRTSCKFEF